MLFLRLALQQVPQQCLQQHPRRVVPERVADYLKGDQTGRNAEDVLLTVMPPLAVVSDIAEGIIPNVGGVAVGQIDFVDSVPRPLQNAAHLPPQRAFRVGDNHALTALQDVGDDVSSGLSRAGRADDDVVIVQTGIPGVTADCPVLS